MYISDVKDHRVQRLRKLFTDPVTEVHLMFLDSFLHTLTAASLTLQQSDPIIHDVYTLMHNTVQSAITRFAILDGENYDIEELETKTGSYYHIYLYHNNNIFIRKLALSHV